MEAQLQTRKWEDKDGIEKYTTEVVLQNFNGNLTMLGENNGSQSSSPTPVDNKPIDDEMPF